MEQTKVSTNHYNVICLCVVTLVTLSEQTNYEQVNNGSFIAYDKVAFKDPLNNLTHAPLGLLAEVMVLVFLLNPY